MKKILWIVDGVGWGYDILSAAITKELPGYEHVRIARNFIRVIANGKSSFICEPDEDFQKRIDAVDADLIISMNPQNKRFLRNKKRAIVRFSGTRALGGWQR